MEKDVLEKIKIHYTLKHIHPEMFDGDFYDASQHLESEMANDSKFTRCVIEEYWDDYFKNRPLYI